MDAIDQSMNAEPSETSDQTIDAWIGSKQADVFEHQRRQVVHCVLHAIYGDIEFGKRLVLKGGVLMALAHASSRQTADVDFTGIGDASDFEGRMVSRLGKALQRSPMECGYLDLRCQIQGASIQPPGEDRNFQMLVVRVASARTNDRNQMERLANGNAVHVTKIEIGFNEWIGETNQLIVDDNDTRVIVYSISDLIAEKYRALLQQPVRNRVRRQDVFDIKHVLARLPDNTFDKTAIHKAIVEKCRIRGLRPQRNSISGPDVMRMAKAEYTTLQLEQPTNNLDFDTDFEVVQQFYESLPWDS